MSNVTVEKLEMWMIENRERITNVQRFDFLYGQKRIYCFIYEYSDGYAVLVESAECNPHYFIDYHSPMHKTRKLALEQWKDKVKEIESNVGYYFETPKKDISAYVE
jgi:hypothetical protein